MGMIDLSNLKNELGKIEKKENKVDSTAVTLLNKEDLPLIELTDSKEINSFLQDEYLTFLNLAQNSALSYGRLLERVYLKLKELDGETTYCKFLDIIGTNRMTALRYRRRAKLYDAVNEEYRKKILLFRDDFIAKLYQLDDFEALISFMNDGASKEDLEEWIAGYLKAPKEKEKEILELPEISFSSFKTNFIENFDKIEMLEEKKQREIAKYLQKIEKIIKGER